MQELQPPKLITTPLTEAVIATLRAGDRVLISGELITARDAAHRRFIELIRRGQPLPLDLQGRIVYYVGPAPTPPGKIMGSAGPTTSERMDAFTPDLLAMGLKGMVGKGNRSPEVREAIRKYLAIYLVPIAGTSVILSRRVRSVETICYEDLGTEAVRRLVVEDFPAVVVNDMYGGDLYEQARERYAREVNDASGLD